VNIAFHSWFLSFLVLIRTPESTTGVVPSRLSINHRIQRRVQ